MHLGRARRLRASGPVTATATPRRQQPMRRCKLTTDRLGVATSNNNSVPPASAPPFGAPSSTPSSSRSSTPTSHGSSDLGAPSSGGQEHGRASLSAADDSGADDNGQPEDSGAESSEQLDVNGDDAQLEDIGELGIEASDSVMGASEIAGPDMGASEMAGPDMAASKSAMSESAASESVVSGSAASESAMSESAASDLEDASLKINAILAPVILLLIVALVFAIRHWCIQLLLPTPATLPQPALPVTFPPLHECLRSSSDVPLLPAGARAPLSAMAMTVALFPAYAQDWTLSRAAVPITAPLFYSEIQRRSARALDLALEMDFGWHTRVGYTPLLDWWWDRILRPSNRTAIIADYVKGALSMRSTPVWKQTGIRVLCAMFPSWDRRSCATQAFLTSPIHTGLLPANLATLARRACLQPGVQLNVTKTRTAIREMQAGLSADIVDIVDRAGDEFSSHVRNLSRADNLLLPKALQLPPKVEAPWSPPNSESTRRGKGFFLREASIVAGVQIPSQSDQQKLHILAALYTRTLYYDFFTSFIESLNAAIQERCRFAMDVTSSLERDALDRLLVQPDADSLIDTLLNMTDSAFQHLHEQVDQNASNFPLLHPETLYYPRIDIADLIRGVATWDANTDTRTIGTFIGRDTADYMGNYGEGPVKSLARNIFDKTWKFHALLVAREWGKMRSEQPSSSSSSLLQTSTPPWLQCLADSSSSSSRSSSSDKTRDQDQDQADLSSRALATQAVWTFWQTGATPDWRTYDYPLGNTGCLGPAPNSASYGDSSSAVPERDPERDGCLLYPPENSETERYEGRTEVDLDHVFGWGLQDD